MKIIISHDVDHLYLREHFSDSFIPGLAKRSLQSFFRGGISLGQVKNRFSKKLNRIEELHHYNLSLGIRETFFFGMRNGLNLSYHWKDARPFIDYLLSENVLIGLHGQGYNDETLLKEEKERLQTMLPADYPLGIRNHYLRKAENSFSIMERLGFLYDSTDYHLEPPRKIGRMWEIPISVMDAGFVSHHKNDRSALKQRTFELIEQAERSDLPFFVINFHDVLFGEGYPDFRFWYQWLTRHLHSQRYEFINFNDAYKLLNLEP